MDALAIMVYGHWEPGIGSPDFISGVIALVYLIGIGLCAWAWRRERAAAASSGKRLLPSFWLAAAVLLLIEGINKQLDLQSWFIQAGREYAQNHALYALRQQVQFLSILGSAVVGIFLLAVAAWLLRRVWRRYLLPLLGFALLAVVMLMRAYTYVHMDDVPPDDPLDTSWAVADDKPQQQNKSDVRNGLELAGILLVAVPAFLAARQKYKPKLKAFETTVRIR